MHIVYHCVGGTHSSATAAAIHLGHLPIDHRPTVDAIKENPYFDRLKKPQQGHIILRGKDGDGHQIYTLSRQYVPYLVLPALKDAWVLSGSSLDTLMLVSVQPAVNTLMKIGGYSSRRLHLVKFGRPIVAKGTWQAYMDIVHIVEKTKETLKLNLS